MIMRNAESAMNWFNREMLNFVAWVNKKRQKSENKNENYGNVSKNKIKIEISLKNFLLFLRFSSLKKKSRVNRNIPPLRIIESIKTLANWIPQCGNFLFSRKKRWFWTVESFDCLWGAKRGSREFDARLENCLLNWSFKANKMKMRKMKWKYKWSQN